MARVEWADLPGEIRRWVEEALGSRVVAAVSQGGGFSPGAACRLRLAGGGRAFVKAVSAAANPQSPVMHRREAVVAAALPAEVPAPEFLSAYDEDGWVALLFADVGGRPPAEPWDRAELELVLAAMNRLHELLTPSPLVAAPTIAEHYAADLTGWRTLAAAPPASSAVLDPWCRRHLDELAELESGWADAAAGTTLLHDDLRADNMLITADGVVFVDWPHASVGASFFDLVAFAPSVAMQGGPDPEWLVERVPSAANVDADAMRAVVAAIAGYFTYNATLPVPPGLPTIRAFQEAQGVPARAWLRRLTGSS
jgi:aminoglycoside phosphotransferase (APT) family kinase protein